MKGESVKTKEISVLNKVFALNKLSKSIQTHINEGNYKKADILSFWVNDFVNYYDNEKDFDSTKLRRYRRGDIIKVNLGFNVGRRIWRITLLYCNK